MGRNQGGERTSANQEMAWLAGRQEAGFHGSYFKAQGKQTLVTHHAVQSQWYLERGNSGGAQEAGSGREPVEEDVRSMHCAACITGCVWSVAFI